MSAYRAFEPLIISNRNTDIHNVFLFVRVQCAPDLRFPTAHPLPPSAATRRKLTRRRSDLRLTAVRAAT